MSFKRKIWNKFQHLYGVPSAADYTEEIIKNNEIEYALDIGCGYFSNLTRFRSSKLKSIGIDTHEPAIASAKSKNVHDHYILANIIDASLEDIQDMLESEIGRRTVDLVTSYGMIEHLPKEDGWKLLKKCDKLSEKYVLIDTPNGYVPQGAEFGNEHQRHLSGWFPNEFRSMAYTVRGNSGTRYLRGYGGRKRIPIPGILLFDMFLSRVLFSNYFPSHAFNITATKDVRGVSAIYPNIEDREKVSDFIL